MNAGEDCGVFSYFSADSPATDPGSYCVPQTSGWRVKTRRQPAAVFFNHSPYRPAYFGATLPAGIATVPNRSGTSVRSRIAELPANFSTPPTVSASTLRKSGDAAGSAG